MLDSVSQGWLCSKKATGFLLLDSNSSPCILRMTKDRLAGGGVWCNLAAQRFVEAFPWNLEKLGSPCLVWNQLPLLYALM